MTITFLVVSGTLMYGLELDPNVQKTGGIFACEDRTDTRYRLWSINDRHSGMIRVNEGETYVDIETRQLPLTSFAALSVSEPAGPAIGEIKLADGSGVPGAPAENWPTKGRREIIGLGSWRKYTRHFHAV